MAAVLCWRTLFQSTAASTQSTLASTSLHPASRRYDSLVHLDILHASLCMGEYREDYFPRPIAYRSRIDLSCIGLLAALPPQPSKVRP
ncbi:hypothetical protein F4825DRAFT_416357 [Nemania diffusa]|nr:hypothetical protein F4825DRAFT_416357 [Nemania diffusa]